MSGYYKRPPGASWNDFQVAKVFEDKVAEALQPYVTSKTTSNSELDFRILGGTVLEVKEKRQKFGPRFLKHIPEGWNHEDVFCIDELTLRKGLLVGTPHVYFVLRDVPGDRMFFASLSELISAERVRRDRGGKGKLLYRLTDFMELETLDDLLPLIAKCCEDEAWRWSNCLAFGINEIKQI